MRHADGTAAKVVEIEAELTRLRNQVDAAMAVVNRGVELMPDGLVGQWAGVRSFLEQGTADYEPFDESANVKWPTEMSELKATGCRRSWRGLA